MRKLLILAVLALAGCESQPRDPEPEWAVDQSLRHKIFMACMGALPAGPLQTKYNDWDEVVDACANAAYRQALVCVKNCPTLPKPQ